MGKLYTVEEKVFQSIAEVKAQISGWSWRWEIKVVNIVELL